MKICDRCKNPQNRAVRILRDAKDGTEIDFCISCDTEFNTFLENKPKPEAQPEAQQEASKVGRPRKDGPK